MIKYLLLRLGVIQSILMIPMLTATAQEGTATDVNNGALIEKTPIRPVQNENFYPEIDENSGKDKCLVGEFRLIALNTQNPAERRKIAEAWIKEQAKFCTIAKLLSIRNNRAQWLGTADSISIDAELDMQLEIALEKNDETFAALYGLKLPPPPPDDEEVQ